jgi:hypothetical protein
LILLSDLPCRNFGKSYARATFGEISEILHLSRLLPGHIIALA